jgi:hypothetical protein
MVLAFALRFFFAGFAPLRELFLAQGDISRKDAKALRNAKQVQSVNP